MLRACIRYCRTMERDVNPGVQSILEGEAELRGDGKIHPLNHPNLCVQPPGKPTFTGPTHSLINGCSFSTTADSLAQNPCHSAHRKRLILKCRIEQIPRPKIRCIWARL